MFPVTVAYDHQIFAIQQYGGISRYFVELASRVAVSENFSVEVIAPLHFNAYLKGSSLRVIGVHIEPPAGMAGQLVRVFNRVVSPLCLRTKSPRILHETYYASRSFESKRTAVVVTVHDMIHERLASKFNSRDVTARRKRAAVNRADHIICVSEHTRRDLIELLGVPEERTRVIHHGFTLSCPPAAEVVPSPLSAPFLLFVGDRDAHKNFSCLLTAYASSPRLQRALKLVAFGGPPFSHGELSRIRRLTLDEGTVVHFSGSDVLLAWLYRHATALVYPSLYEGFGLPLLESMSYGCPVICSHSAAIPEVAGDAAMYFDPTNPESLQNAIERVVFSEATREELRRLGHRRVGHFSWERCANETMQLYRDLLGK